MNISRHLVVGLALSSLLLACGEKEKTKTVTVQVENKETQAKLEKAEADLKKLQEQLKLANVDQLKADLAAAQKQVDDLTAEKTELDKKIEVANKALEKLGTESSEEKKKLGDEIAALKKEKAGVESKLNSETAKLVAAEDQVKGLSAILDYALANQLSDRASIGDGLEKDIAELENLVKKGPKDIEDYQVELGKQVAEMQKKEEVYKAAIRGLIDIFKEIEAIAEDKRTEEQKKVFAILRKYSDLKAVKEEKDLAAITAKTNFDKNAKLINETEKAVTDLEATIRKSYLELGKLFNSNKDGVNDKAIKELEDAITKSEEDLEASQKTLKDAKEQTEKLENLLMVAQSAVELASQELEKQANEYDKNATAPAFEAFEAEVKKTADMQNELATLNQNLAKATADLDAAKALKEFFDKNVAPAKQPESK